MKTTYLVWENPGCNGINPIWKELAGQEFLALVRSAEAAGRYFVKLENAQDGTAIVIEATKANYLAWRKEKRHREYLETCAGDKHIVSYHALKTDDGYYGEETLEDKEVDVLSESLAAIARETLKAALASLSADEYELIAYLYLAEKRGTERGYAALHGVTQKAINKKKNSVLTKLKNFFDE